MLHVHNIRPWVLMLMLRQKLSHSSGKVADVLTCEETPSLALHILLNMQQDIAHISAK